jgi:hypothetical protein
MRLAHVAGERQIVLAQFGQHVAGRHEVRVIVENPLQLGDLAGGLQCLAAYLACTFRDRVGRCED